jgi:ribose-phosphate pyrophosphokinase
MVDLNGFVTQEMYNERLSTRCVTSNGILYFVGCNSGTELMIKTKDAYQKMMSEKDSNVEKIDFLSTVTRKMKDTEICPRLKGHVGGADAYVFQSFRDRHLTISPEETSFNIENFINLVENSSNLNPIQAYAIDSARKSLKELKDYAQGPTINDNYIELLQVIRALKENRAANITAVLPYLAYSWQDKPSFQEREPTTARLMADLKTVAGADYTIVWHAHFEQIKGFYPTGHVLSLNPLSYFYTVFEKFKGEKDVCVLALDPGSSKLSERLANRLELPLKISAKLRTEQDKSESLGILGKLGKEHTALFIDDLIRTGGTVFDPFEIAHKHGVKNFYGAISHTSLAGNAVRNLDKAHSEYGLELVHTTESVKHRSEILDKPWLTQDPLSVFLARVINRLHTNESVSELDFTKSDITLD